MALAIAHRNTKQLKSQHPRVAMGELGRSKIPTNSLHMHEVNTGEVVHARQQPTARLRISKKVDVRNQRSALDLGFDN